jgi:hypothetical protein
VADLTWTRDKFTGVERLRTASGDYTVLFSGFDYMIRFGDRSLGRRRTADAAKQVAEDHHNTQEE